MSGNPTALPHGSQAGPAGSATVTIAWLEAALAGREKWQARAGDILAAFQDPAIEIESVADIVRSSDGTWARILVDGQPLPAAVVDQLRDKAKAPPTGSQGGSGFSIGATHLAKQPVIKHPSLNLSASIPFQYHVPRAGLKGLEDLITTRINDNVGISIFDVPGAGKSTTVFHAAARTNSAYIRVRADRGVLQSAKLLMLEQIPSLNPNLTLGELQVKLQDACYGALFVVFSFCLKKLESDNTIQFGQLTTNGTEPCNKETCVNKCTELMSRIAHATNKDTSFVLHIDEAHAWAVPSQVECKRENDKIDAPHYKDYLFVVLSNVFEELRAVVPVLKIAITGTNVLMDVVIRFASQFKVQQILLGPISAEAALTVCELLLDLSALSQDQKWQLAEEIAYNGRSIQYFIWQVYIAPEMQGKEANTLTLAALQLYVKLAYGSWLAAIINDTNTCQTEEESYTTFMEMLLVFVYPTQFRGVRQVSGAVRFAPASNFPAKWLQLAQAGAVQVKNIGDDCLDMYEPKGFLLRWITTKISQKVNKDTALMFFAFAVSSSTEHVGTPGHFFERAIAAELTMPRSPLYHKMTELIHTPATLQAHLLMPNPLLALKPVKFEADIQSHAGSMDSVYCVEDMNNVPNRNVDVGFSMTVADKTQVNVWLEIKTVSDPTLLWRQAACFFALPLKDGFRVFISLYRFTDYSPQQHSTSNDTKSAKESKLDWETNKRSAVDVHNRHLYTIIEGIESFSDCFLPFSEQMKHLNGADFKLLPGEANMPFSAVVEQLLPAVIAAKVANRPRTSIVSRPIFARAGTFSADDASMSD